MGFERLTAYLDALEERYGVPGADLKITRGHDLVYRHMVGHRDYEKQIPVSAEDMYNIYSGSKPITMAGAMQLIEQGKVSLDTDVSQLAGFPIRNPKYPDTVITLEMLLSHTSSINDSQG